MVDYETFKNNKLKILRNLNTLAEEWTKDITGTEIGKDTNRYNDNFKQVTEKIYQRMQEWFKT